MIVVVYVRQGACRESENSSPTDQARRLVIERTAQLGANRPERA